MSHFIPVSQSHMSLIKRGELEAVRILHPHFNAVILIQGGQLIEFSTIDRPDNWLWLGEKVQYKKGKAVRGGVPICYPLFGDYEANHKAVKDSFSYGMIRHGFGRMIDWHFERGDLADEIEPSDKIRVTFELKKENIPIYPNLPLQAELVFEFHRYYFAIYLNVTNTSDKVCNFSQGFHTYFNTSDITQTHIEGFDGTPYVETTAKGAISKNSFEQTGDIVFNQEVDRIYFASPDIELVTLESRILLQAKGSDSTIVWNPWVEKSADLDQFLPNDYQKMLCIETANADKNYVALPPKQTHQLAMKVSYLT